MNLDTIEAIILRDNSLYVERFFLLCWMPFSNFDYRFEIGSLKNSYVSNFIHK